MSAEWAALPARTGRKRQRQAGGAAAAAPSAASRVNPGASRVDSISAAVAARAGGGHGGSHAALAAALGGDASLGGEASQQGGGDAAAGYRYLDHTADVQLHAWWSGEGDSFAGALGQCGDALFGYVTDRDAVNPEREMTVRAHGHDEASLTFSLLDELLYLFAGDGFVCRTVEVVELARGGAKAGEGEGGDGDGAADKTGGDLWKVRAVCTGETFDVKRHPQGTEVKAITYSNLQVHHVGDKTDIFVVVDI